MKNKPGTMIVRIPKDLKHRIEKVAEQQGVSINQLALYMFTKEINDLETTNYFEKYWINKSKKEIFNDFDIVMDKVSNSEVPDWDKF
jgi:FAD synthase